MLVGDDFRFGAKRAGDYAMLDAAGQAQGFDVARMRGSYEVRGLRVSSSAVRQALGAVTWKLPRPAGAAVHHLRACGAWPQAERALGASADGAQDGFAP